MAPPRRLPGLSWDEGTQRYYACTRVSKGEDPCASEPVPPVASYFRVVRGRETTGCRRSSRTGGGIEATNMGVTWSSGNPNEREAIHRGAGGLVPKPEPDETDEPGRTRPWKDVEYVVASKGARACVRWMRVRDEGSETKAEQHHAHAVDCVPHLSAMRCRWDGEETVRVTCTTTADGRRKNGKLVVVEAKANDTSDVHIRSKCECTLRGKGDLWTLEQTHDGKKISVGSEAGAFVVNAERTTMDLLWSEPRKQHAAMAQQFDRTGNLLYNGRRNGSIVVYDLRQGPNRGQQGSDAGKLLVRENTGISTLQLVRPNETYLISGTFGGRIQLWDVRAAKQPVHTFVGLNSGGMQYDVALGKSAQMMDAYVVAPGADSKVKVWDILTAKLLSSIDCGEEMPDKVACTRWGGQFTVWVASERGEQAYQHGIE